MTARADFPSERAPTPATAMRSRSILVLAIGCAGLASSAAAQGLRFRFPLLPGYPRSCASAGDVDADGFQDFLFGAVRDQQTPGIVRVHSGHDGAQLLELAGALAGDGFGMSVAALGDVDGDGRGDFAAGAGAWTLASTESYVRAHSGATGAPLWRFDATGAKSSVGTSIARLADIDLDGVDDLAVGAPSRTREAGSVLVLSGRNGRMLRAIPGPNGASYGFGTAVRATPDLDQDGAEDVLVGDPFYGPGLGWPFQVVRRGRATLHSARTGAVLREFRGSPLGGEFGSVLAVPGDVDADGVGDFAIGAPREPIVPLWQEGRVRVYSGATGALLLQLDAAPLQVRFGEAIDRAPDLDADGRPDLLVGTGSWRVGGNTYVNAGVSVISSATGAVLQHGVDGSTPGIATVPDADADGRDDYLLTYVGYPTTAALALTRWP